MVLAPSWDANVHRRLRFQNGTLFKRVSPAREDVAAALVCTGSGCFCPVLLQELQDLGVSVSFLHRVVDFFNLRFASEPPLALKYFDSRNAWLLVSVTKHVRQVE